MILGKCQDCGVYVYAYNGQTFRLHRIAGRYVYLHDCKGDRK